MDVFVEQIIKRKLNVKDAAIYFGVIVLGLVLIFLSATYLLSLTQMPMLPFLVLCGVCYGSYWVISSRSVEFEYSITNGDITVDKIINRRKRKRVCSFDAKNIEEMGQYHAEKLQHRSFQKREFAGIYEDGREEWYVAVRSEKTGYMLLVFAPEQRVLDAIKPFLQRQVKNETFGRN